MDIVIHQQVMSEIVLKITKPLGLEVFMAQFIRSVVLTTARILEGIGKWWRELKVWKPLKYTGVLMLMRVCIDSMTAILAFILL